MLRRLLPLVLACPVFSLLAAVEDPIPSRIVLFHHLDTDQDNRLTEAEFLASYDKPGKPLDAEGRARYQRFFASLDANHDQHLILDEYLQAWSPPPAAEPPPAPVPALAVKAEQAPPEAGKAETAEGEHPTPAVAGAKPKPADDEKDEVDPSLAHADDLNPWTEYQRRSIENILLPSTAVVPAGSFHYRILHVARDRFDRDSQTNLLGLDDSVKIGLQLGYGIADGFDVNVTRINGRTLNINTGEKPARYDAWDVLFKYHLADQYQGARLADVAVVAGATWLQRNQGRGDLSLDLMLLAERNFFHDRIRLGVGIARAGLGTYEAAAGFGPATKPLPDEIPDGTDAPETASTAMPITLKIALTERWQVFAELVQPIQGWNTGAGPATVAGARFNTHTHEYCFYVGNTANVAFNSVVVGGGGDAFDLPLFGFAITAHL